MSAHSQQKHWENCIDLMQQGNWNEALTLLATKSVPASPEEECHQELVLGIESILGRQINGLHHFTRAFQLDSDNQSARLNAELLKVDQLLCNDSPISPNKSKRGATKVAVLSFLFNWPSTGGGIVHTVELCDFLQRAGYEVQHIYARYEPWGIGVVTQVSPMNSVELRFSAAQWTASSIQDAYRQAVDAFQPDYVIITDSWNMKPLLAEAVEKYPYLLRLQALECLCPLNNIRLLPGDDGGFKQCPLNQLATPQGCHQCVRERGQRSGSLHRDERHLSGFGTSDYQERLEKVFRRAHAVLVVNPLTEAIVAPYVNCVRTVTAGMNPARFPDPWPNDPAPSLERVKKQILFAGLIDETIKGFHVLHEACQLLWQERQDFELLVTADPVGPIDQHTRTVGWQSQESLPHTMRSVDIIAVPAIAQEALGRTAVEAMAAGRPVVASRLGGLPFTIPDGATGLLFEPGNPFDLARKLGRLLDDTSLRSTLGVAGRQRFLEHYSWPVIIEKHYRPLLVSPVRQNQ